MKPLYVTASGRYYVDVGPMGTYDVKAWPSQTLIGNRDWKNQAVALADECDKEAFGGVR